MTDGALPAEDTLTVEEVNAIIGGSAAAERNMQRLFENFAGVGITFLECDRTLLQRARSEPGALLQLVQCGDVDTISHHQIWTLAAFGANQRVSSFNRRQDPKSRAAVQNLMSAIGHLETAVREITSLAALGDADLAVTNIAKHVVIPGVEFDRLKADLAMVREVSSIALLIGEAPRRGGGKEVVPYSRFAIVLREIWDAKKPSNEPGYYRHESSWAGPFVNLVAKSEFVLPEELRSQTAHARGRRLSRLFGWADRKTDKHEISFCRAP